MIPCHISEVFRENVALPPNTCRNVTNTNNIKLTAAAQILCILISPTSTPLQPIPGANLSDIFAPSAVHISSKTKFQAPGLHATRDPGMLVQGDMEYPDTSPCQFLRRTVGSNFCEEIKHCRNNIKQPVCRSLLTEAWRWSWIVCPAASDRWQISPGASSEENSANDSIPAGKPWRHMASRMRQGIGWYWITVI